MRVLQAMAGAEYGGAEAFFTRLLPALARAGVEQRAVIRAHPRRAEALRAAEIEVVEVPFGGALDVYSPYRLRREIARFAPDVVMTWMNRASAACPRGSYAHVGRLGGYYDLKYYQTCDRLLVNTEDIAAWCRNAGWPADKVECVPNFVEGTRAEAPPRQQFFTPRGAPLVLGLGRLHENKGFDVLLKAMARIPGAYLWLAGEGPLRGELDALAQKLGIKPRVRFLGWRSDVAALYASCDVFVCPSRHEPLGNVVIESWAHGLPVVATDSLGPGTLIDHLQTGVLVEVDDAESLASAVRLVLEDEDLRRRIVAQGQAAYEARFAESVVVPQFVRFFERMRAPCAASPA